MILSPKMLQSLIASKEILGEISKVVFKYMPEVETKTIAILPELVDELFKKAGYTEVRTMAEVNKHLEEEMEKRRLLATAKVLPLSEKKPVDPRDKLISIEDEEETPEESKIEESPYRGIDPIVGLVAALLGGAMLIDSDSEQNSTEGNFPVTNKELAVLEACESEEDWNNACEAIKSARGGYYPEDWYDRVVNSGFQEKIQSRWRK
jgi:hypothetical protein